MIRKHIVFTGAVQFVGFRWRARKAANMFRCTGWCRNEADGSVTMEIQGTRIQICLALQALRTGKQIRIDSMNVTYLNPIPEERGFRTE